MPQFIGLKKYGGQEGGDEPARQPGFPAIQTKKRIYQVIADNLNQTEDEILATPGIPQPGETIGNSIVGPRHAREVDADARLWEVEVEFSSNIDGSGGGDEDPVDLRPQVRWSSETIEIAITTDQVTGLPLENSVGEPFFITTPYAVPVRTLTRYERHDVLDHYDALIFEYGNSINSDTFHGWPPWTVLLASIDAYDVVVKGELLTRATYVTKYLSYNQPSTYIPKRRYESDVQGPQTTIEEIGWRASLLNHGTKYLENADDNPDDAKPFKDADGNRTTGNLNYDGTKLEYSAPGVPEIVYGNYLRFFKHPTKNLNDLSI